MKKKHFLLRLAAAAVICAVCLTGCAMSACSMPAFSLRKTENPKLTLLRFIEAVRGGDYETAEELTGGTLSFEGFEEDGGSLLTDMLRSSYNVRFADDRLDDVSSPYTDADLTVNGREAQISFTFTHMSFALLEDELAAAVTEIGGERMYYGEVYETEEQALALVNEAFEAVMTEHCDCSDWCVDTGLTVGAHLYDGRWVLDISDAFYSALIGE